MYHVPTGFGFSLKANCFLCFCFCAPQYLTTKPMSLRYSVIIFYGGTKKSLAHREWVGKAMLDGMLFF